MTVYLVYFSPGRYDEDELSGVFSTREKAEAYIGEQSGYHIEDVLVDEMCP